MKVPDTEDNAAICICPGCPTYNDCMREASQALYCSRGKTDCSPDQHGCICGECPIKSDYMLSGMYFCINGAEE